MTMIEKTITITLTNGNEPNYSNEGKMVMRMNSSISPKTAVEMIRVIDNKINPREAKSGPITKAIFKTLEEEPELFWLKSKGVVLATTKCEIVPEPNKVLLSFENPEYEGIMDGGHNFLSIANFITTKLLNTPLKTWKDCKTLWDSNYDEIMSAVETELSKPDNILNFSIPVEIIAPTDEEGAIDDYYKIIGGVCDNSAVSVPC